MRTTDIKIGVASKMPERCATVEVALRIRPLVNDEVARGCKIFLEQVNLTPQVRVIGAEVAFTYNYVFGPETKQLMFYSTCVKDLVTKLFRGYNVTVLAYGQTSSGKTFSMGTSCAEGEDMGVIPRAVRDIFEEVRVQTDYKFTIRVSYMELYQEQLFDLLAPNKALVDIREDGKGIVKVPRLTEVVVSTADHTMELLTQGSSWRATGATAMNSQSSRSHAIFTISVHKQDRRKSRVSFSSKFHFVDLAGSERQNKCKSSGERLRESISINRGLLALGNVISALGEECPRAHITYRDSKLTRILQDSLGGNSLTLLIACVSPADYNASETLSTLRYAYRAKRIKNKPIINVDTGDVNAQIMTLKLEKERLRLQLAVLDESTAKFPEENRAYEERYAKLVKKNAQLVAALNAAYDDNIHLAQSALLAELERDRIKVQLSELQVQYNDILKNVKESGSNTLSDPAALRLLYRLKHKIQDLQLEDKHATKAQESLNHLDSVSDLLEEEESLLIGRAHCTCCTKHREMKRCATSPGRVEHYNSDKVFVEQNISGMNNRYTQQPRQ